MSDAATPSGPADSPKSEGPLRAAARTAATLAQQLKSAVAGLAGASGIAGILLWGFVWWPGHAGGVAIVLETVSFLVLLAPAVILGLFYQGLTDLLALPGRLAHHSARTADQSVSAARAVTDSPSSGLVSRIWSVVRQIWTLRSVLLENRALLVRYGALVRFVNPGFLLLVAVATLVSLFLIPGTLIIGAIVLLV